MQAIARILVAMCFVTVACADDRWLEFEGSGGAGSGLRAVLISGDEEYRSERGLTQLAKILSTHHGFQTTVLFAIDPESGIINPHVRDNIPGLAALAEADLMIIATRWRVLPPEQMAHIAAYLEAGKPVIGMRTATHAFAPPADIHPAARKYLRNPDGPNPIPDDAWGEYGHWGDGYFGPRNAWKGGFGRLVLGERWIAHHGKHKHESTTGLVAPDAKSHPILRGIADGDIWGSTDVYRVRLPLPADSRTLVLGSVTARAGEYNESDPDFGMRASDNRAIASKNSPHMPVAWTKSYQVPSGNKGRAFTTTMGSATDLDSAGVRRLLVQAAMWAVGREEKIPAGGAMADLVGDYAPEQYSNLPREYWEKRAVRPHDLK